MSWNKTVDDVFDLDREYPFLGQTVELYVRDFNPYHKPAGNEQGGEFAEAPGGMAAAMQKSLENSGGFTFDAHGNTPKKGFAVGGYDGKPQWDVASFTAKDAADFLAQNKDLLSSGSHHVGGWVDNGKVYLDVVRVFGSRRGAVKAGKKNNQIAVTDLSRISAGDFDHAFIPTGGTGDTMPDDDDEGTNEIKGAFHLFPENVTAEELVAALTGVTKDSNPAPVGSDADISRHARASKDRLLTTANWLRELATSDWLKDIDETEDK